MPFDTVMPVAPLQALSRERVDLSVNLQQLVDMVHESVHVRGDKRDGKECTTLPLRHTVVQPTLRLCLEILGCQLHIRRVDGHEQRLEARQGPLVLLRQRRVAWKQLADLKVGVALAHSRVVHLARLPHSVLRARGRA
jgi:hypothetical protein